MADQDYTASGFDNFLSRDVESNPQINLDSPAPKNNSIAFDRNQVTGALGDTLKIGKIYLNGSAGNIILNDGNNDRLLIGQQDGGF